MLALHTPPVNAQGFWLVWYVCQHFTCYSKNARASIYCPRSVYFALETDMEILGSTAFGGKYYYSLSGANAQQALAAACDSATSSVFSTSRCVTVTEARSLLGTIARSRNGHPSPCGRC